MTKIIKILGTGCPKCKTLTALVEEVVSANNIDATVVKVEDIMEIMQYDIMSTPALVIDEVIVVKGRVASKNEILALLGLQTDGSIEKNKDNTNQESSCCS